MADPDRPAREGPGLDHVGVAVPSIDDALPLWRDELGLALAEIEEVPEEGVRVAVLLAGSTRIELLEPLNDESPIAAHLRKRGPGIHHLAIEVDDVEAATERCRAAGRQPLSDEPRAGAGGARIQFLHPKTTGGVLLELTSGHRAGRDDAGGER